MTAGGAALDVADSGGPWSPAYRTLTAGLLLTVVGVAFEALAVATIMPKTADELGRLDLYGWAFSAFMLTNLVGVAVAGSEADLQGPGRPFLIGTGLFVLGLIVGGLAPSMPVLILGRVIQGFGGGVISSVVYVVVGRGYPEAGRPRMLALLSSAWVVPGLIGPALAGVIADQIGWRWVFLGLAPLPPLAMLLALPAVRRIPGGALERRDRGRWASAAQLAAGAGVLLAGLGRSSPLIAAPVAVAGAAIAWPALGRLMPAGLLRARPGLPAAIAVMSLLNLSFFGVDAYVPLALVDVRGRTTTFAGLALTAATITWTAGSWLLAREAARRGRRELVSVGLALIAVGSGLTAAVLSPAVTVWLGPFAWGIAGLGMGIAYATLSLTVLETAPKGEEGTATSSMQLGNVLGTALGTGIGGVFVAALGEGDEATAVSLLVPFLLMIGVAIGAIVLAGRLPGRR